MEGKGFGVLDKLKFKIHESVGNIEQTQMTKEFNADLAKYESYNPAMNKLISSLEGIYQPNEKVLATSKVECAPGEDPFEKVKHALDQFKGLLSPDGAASVTKVANMVDKAAKVQREHQVKQRQCIRHIRRFQATEFQQLCEMKAKFNQTREAMDLAKHEVTTSKTTEQVEKRAIIYKQHVERFDDHSNKMIKLLEELPTIKSTHEKDLTDLLVAHKDAHTALSQCFT